MSSIERHYVLGHLNATGGKINKMLPLKEDGKYLTSKTSILSKSMDARSNSGFFLDFASFKTSTLVNPIDEGEGCSGGRGESEIWGNNLLYIGPYGNFLHIHEVVKEWNENF